MNLFAQVVGIVGYQHQDLPPPQEGDPFLVHMCSLCMQQDPHARPTFPQIVTWLDQQFGPASWSNTAEPLLPPGQEPIQRLLPQPQMPLLLPGPGQASASGNAAAAALVGAVAGMPHVLTRRSSTQQQVLPSPVVTPVWPITVGRQRSQPLLLLGSPEERTGHMQAAAGVPGAASLEGGAMGPAASASIVGLHEPAVESPKVVEVATATGLGVEAQQYGRSTVEAGAGGLSAQGWALPLSIEEPASGDGGLLAHEEEQKQQQWQQQHQEGAQQQSGHMPWVQTQGKGVMSDSAFEIHQHGESTNEAVLIREGTESRVGAGTEEGLASGMGMTGKQDPEQRVGIEEIVYVQPGMQHEEQERENEEQMQEEQEQKQEKGEHKMGEQKQEQENKEQVCLEGQQQQHNSLVQQRAFADGIRSLGFQAGLRSALPITPFAAIARAEAQGRGQGPEEALSLATERVMGGAGETNESVKSMRDWEALCEQQHMGQCACGMQDCEHHLQHQQQQEHVRELMHAEQVQQQQGEVQDSGPSVWVGSCLPDAQQLPCQHIWGSSISLAHGVEGSAASRNTSAATALWSETSTAIAGGLWPPFMSDGSLASSRSSLVVQSTAQAEQLKQAAAWTEAVLAADNAAAAASSNTPPAGAGVAGVLIVPPEAAGADQVLQNAGPDVAPAGTGDVLESSKQGGLGVDSGASCKAACSGCGSPDRDSEDGTGGGGAAGGRGGQDERGYVSAGSGGGGSTGEVQQQGGTDQPQEQQHRKQGLGTSQHHHQQQQQELQVENSAEAHPASDPVDLNKQALRQLSRSYQRGRFHVTATEPAAQDRKGEARGERRASRIRDHAGGEACQPAVLDFLVGEKEAGAAAAPHPAPKEEQEEEQRQQDEQQQRQQYKEQRRQDKEEQQHQQLEQQEQVSQQPLFPSLPMQCHALHDIGVLQGLATNAAALGASYPIYLASAVSTLQALQQEQLDLHASSAAAGTSAVSGFRAMGQSVGATTGRESDSCYNSSYPRQVHHLLPTTFSEPLPLSPSYGVLLAGAGVYGVSHQVQLPLLEAKGARGKPLVLGPVIAEQQDEAQGDRQGHGIHPQQQQQLQQQRSKQLRRPLLAYHGSCVDCPGLLRVSSNSSCSPSPTGLLSPGTAASGLCYRRGRFNITVGGSGGGSGKGVKASSSSCSLPAEALAVAGEEYERYGSPLAAGFAQHQRHQQQVLPSSASCGSLCLGGMAKGGGSRSDPGGAPLAGLRLDFGHMRAEECSGQAVAGGSRVGVGGGEVEQGTAGEGAMGPQAPRSSGKPPSGRPSSSVSSHASSSGGGGLGSTAAAAAGHRLAAAAVSGAATRVTGVSSAEGSGRLSSVEVSSMGSSRVNSAASSRRPSDEAGRVTGNAAEGHVVVDARKASRQGAAVEGEAAEGPPFEPPLGADGGGGAGCGKSLFERRAMGALGRISTQRALSAEEQLLVGTLLAAGRGEATGIKSKAASEAAAAATTKATVSLGASSPSNSLQVAVNAAVNGAAAAAGCEASSGEGGVAGRLCQEGSSLSLGTTNTGCSSTRSYYSISSYTEEEFPQPLLLRAQQCQLGTTPMLGHGGVEEPLMGEDDGAALQRGGERLRAGRGTGNLRLPDIQAAGTGEAPGRPPSCCSTPGALESPGGGERPHAAGTKAWLAGQQKKLRWCADLIGPPGMVGGEGGASEAGVCVQSRQEKEGGYGSNLEQSRKERVRREKYSRTSSSGHNQQQQQPPQQQHRAYASDPGGDGDPTGGVKDYCRGRFHVHEALLYGPLPQRKGAAVAPPPTPVARAGAVQQSSIFGEGSTYSISEHDGKVKNASPAGEAGTAREGAAGVPVGAVATPNQSIRAEPSAHEARVLGQQGVGTLAAAAAAAAGPASPSCGLIPAPVSAVSAVQMGGASGSCAAEMGGPSGSVVAEAGRTLEDRGGAGDKLDGPGMGTAAAATAPACGAGVGGAVQLSAVQQPEAPAAAVGMASQVAVVNFKVGRFTVRQESHPNSRASSKPSSPRGDDLRPQMSKLGSLKQGQGPLPRVSNSGSSRPSSRPGSPKGEEQRQQVLGKMVSWKQQEQQQQQQVVHVEVQQEQFSTASTLGSSISSREQQVQQQQRPLSKLGSLKQQGWLESSTTRSTSRESSMPGSPTHEDSHLPTAASRLGSLKKMGRIVIGDGSSSNEGAAAAATSGMRTRQVGRFVVTDQPVLLSAGPAAPVVNTPSSSCSVSPALHGMAMGAPAVPMGEPSLGITASTAAAVLECPVCAAPNQVELLTPVAVGSEGPGRDGVGLGSGRANVLPAGGACVVAGEEAVASASIRAYGEDAVDCEHKASEQQVPSRSEEQQQQLYTYPSAAADNDVSATAAAAAVSMGGFPLPSLRTTPPRSHHLANLIASSTPFLTAHAVAAAASGTAAAAAALSPAAAAAALAAGLPPAALFAPASPGQSHLITCSSCGSPLPSSAHLLERSCSGLRGQAADAGAGVWSPLAAAGASAPRAHAEGFDLATQHHMHDKQEQLLLALAVQGASEQQQLQKDVESRLAGQDTGAAMGAPFALLLQAPNSEPEIMNALRATEAWVAAQQLPQVPLLLPASAASVSFGGWSCEQQQPQQQQLLLHQGPLLLPAPAQVVPPTFVEAAGVESLMLQTGFQQQSQQLVLLQPDLGHADPAAAEGAGTRYHHEQQLLVQQQQPQADSCGIAIVPEFHPVSIAMQTAAAAATREPGILPAPQGLLAMAAAKVLEERALQQQQQQLMRQPGQVQGDWEASSCGSSSCYAVVNGVRCKSPFCSPSLLEGVSPQPCEEEGTSLVVPAAGQTPSAACLAAAVTAAPGPLPKSSHLCQMVQWTAGGGSDGWVVGGPVRGAGPQQQHQQQQQSQQQQQRYQQPGVGIEHVACTTGLTGPTMPFRGHCAHSALKSFPLSDADLLEPSGSCSPCRYVAEVGAGDTLAAAAIAAAGAAAVNQQGGSHHEQGELQLEEQQEQHQQQPLAGLHPSACTDDVNLSQHAPCTAAPGALASPPPPPAAVAAAAAKDAAPVSDASDQASSKLDSSGPLPLQHQLHMQQQYHQQQMLSGAHAVLDTAGGMTVLPACGGSRPHTPSRHRRQSSQDQQYMADHPGLLPALVLPPPAVPAQLQLDAIRCTSHCQSGKGSKHGTPRSEQPRSDQGTPRSREMSPMPSSLCLGIEEGKTLDTGAVAGGSPAKQQQ